MTLKPSFSHRLQSQGDVKSIQGLEDLGFSCCELFFADREPLGGQAKSLVDEVSSTTNLLLTAHLPYKNINIGSVYPFVRDSSTELLAGIIADISDYVEIVTVHTGFAPPGMDMEEALNGNVKSLARLCEAAGDIKVGVENAINDRNAIGKTAAELEALVVGVGRSNIGITLDIGHANLTGNISDFLARKNYIVELHAHDNFGYSDEHLAPGEGKVDWGYVYDSFNGLDCPLVLETRTSEEAADSLAFWNSMACEEGTHFRLNRIIAAIRSGTSHRELLAANVEMIALAEKVLQDGSRGSEVNRIVTMCREAQACRAAELALEEIKPPLALQRCRFALLATGSFGRAEMSVESDQDTILVYDDSNGETCKEHLRQLSDRLVSILYSSGFSTCKGNMMASNPKWRGTVPDLIGRLESREELSVIMDARYFFGDRPLANRFLRTLHNRLRTDPFYARGLAVSAASASPGLEGGSFRTESFAGFEDMFNIKKYGLRVYTESVKALSVRHGVTKTNVSDRLWKLQDDGVFGMADFKKLLFAYDQLARTMMLGYGTNIRRGVVSNEYVQPFALSKEDRDGLKAALRIVAELQGIVERDFGLEKSKLP